MTPLLSHFGRYRRTVAAGGLALAVSVGLQVAIPWSLKLAFDALAVTSAQGVRRSAALLVGLVVAQAIVRVYGRVTIFNVGRHVEYDLRRAILDQLHRLGPGFFRLMGTGEIMSRAVSDLGNVRLLFGFAALNLINTAFMFAFGLTMMFAISARLTLVSLLGVPVLALAVRVFGRSIFSRSRQAQDQLGKLTSQVQESIAGIRIVRAYGSAAREIEDFERLNSEYVEKNMALIRLRALLFPLMAMVSGLGLLLSLWYGGHLVRQGRIGIGDLVAIQGYLAMLTWPTAALGYILSVYQRGKASYVRIEHILDARPEVPVAFAPQAGRAERVAGDLSVRGLTFRYGDRPVLDDVSFDLPRGQCLAIVGRTGSGKTTLANLLPRLIPTDVGTIFIGGHDTHDLSLAVLRKSIGYSPQEPFLFSTTVARNIAFGLEDPSAPDAMDRIRAAARAAQVVEDIETFPEGFDTIVGERGVQLSGGQKQRIALARALVHEPEILILDDPLSSVDAATERRILDTIDEIARDRTLLIVTHRCSAAARADGIIVLENGRIVERGTHAQLVHRGGLYASFYERQRIEEELDRLEAPMAP